MDQSSSRATLVYCWYCTRREAGGYGESIVVHIVLHPSHLTCPPPPPPTGTLYRPPYRTRSGPRDPHRRGRLLWRRIHWNQDKCHPWQEAEGLEGVQGTSRRQVSRACAFTRHMPRVCYSCTRAKFITRPCVFVGTVQHGVCFGGYDGSRFGGAFSAYDGPRMAEPTQSLPNFDEFVSPR